VGSIAAAIKVERLHFSYGGKPILKGVDLTVPERKFTVVLGRNGSGKSTLLRVMAGLAESKQGRVEFLGADLKQLSTSRRAKIVGYLPQQHRPVFPFLVEDVVLTGRASYVTLVPGKEDRGKALEAMDQAGITHLAGRAFTELSGGEQQLVMIARVLAQEPRIVLLDEPTAHLDFVNQARLLGLIRELVHSGLTVVAVLHDPNAAFLYGDQFLFLRDGLIEPLGTSDQPWDSRFLKTVYGIELLAVPYLDRALIVPMLTRAKPA
jgi:iron complex transport system ATP-binding protein